MNHGKGKISKTADKGMIMLLRQYGGGCQNSNLLSVHDRLEGSTDGNFGFPIAYISA